MTIKVNTFLECIQKMQALSEELHDGWNTCTKEGIDNGTYISKKLIHSVDKNDLTTYQFDVAYNVNYCVPVLCFLAWKSDGSLLTMEECWKYSKFSENENMYSILTQADHPVLGTPYLTFHPCRSNEIIECFLEKSKNPVVSWLSSIGPLVNLNLSPEYLKLT